MTPDYHGRAVVLAQCNLALKRRAAALVNRLAATPRAQRAAVILDDLRWAFSDGYQVRSTGEPPDETGAD